MFKKYYCCGKLTQIHNNHYTGILHYSTENGVILLVGGRFPHISFSYRTVLLDTKRQQKRV